MCSAPRAEDRGRAGGAQQGARWLEGDLGAGAPVGAGMRPGGVRRPGTAGPLPHTSPLADGAVAGALGEARVR